MFDCTGVHDIAVGECCCTERLEPPDVAWSDGDLLEADLHKISTVIGRGKQRHERIARIRKSVGQRVEEQALRAPFIALFEPGLTQREAC